jgi:hypothetical protein
VPGPLGGVAPHDLQYRASMAAAGRVPVVESARIETTTPALQAHPVGRGPVGSVWSGHAPVGAPFPTPATRLSAHDPGLSGDPAGPHRPLHLS